MGGLTRLVGFAVLGLAWLPALALVPATLVDRGPAGGPRVSSFPLALAWLDPFAWTCLGGSVLVASAVAAGSLVVGVLVGTVISRRRFWGRPLLLSLLWVPWAAGPVVVAAGVGLILGGDGGARWDWLDARSIGGLAFSDLARWLGLIVAGWLAGVPVVAGVTAAAWERVDPTWAEAARAVGAARLRVAREVVWPTIRPEVARCAATLFALTMFEPVAPILLGVRRTIAAQVVLSALRDDAPTRAATLVGLGLAVAWIGRVVLNWWGGASVLPRDPDQISAPARRPVVSRRRGLPVVAVLGAWVAVGLAPVLAVVARAIAAGPGEGSRDVLRRLLQPDPGLVAAWTNGATVAVLALVVNVLALLTLFGRPGRPPGAVARGVSSALGWFPPLALAVGGLALPWLALVACDALPSGRVTRVVTALARELDPARSPGLVLALVASAVTLPSLARAVTLARGPIHPVLAEVATNLGATRRRAARDRDGHPARRIPVGPAILALALVATAVTPALLLTPLPERATPGSDLLRRAERAPTVDGRWAAPLALILGVNLAAVAVSRKGRAGPRGEWFRGV